MNKKILSVILTLVLVVSMFTGCDKKESAYFKELKEMCKITTGTQTMEMNVTYKGEDTEEIPAILLDSEGKMTMSLKIEGTTESQTKAAVKIMAKLGQNADYSELTTMVVDEKKLYLAVAPIIDFISRIDSATATQLQTALANIGVTGNVSIDLGQLLEAMGGEYPEITDDMNKSAYEFIEALVDSLEKNFKDLTGQDGDDYTFTINGDNADKAVTGLANFCKNDVKGLVEKLNAVMAKVYGEDSTMYASVKETYNEMADEAANAATSIEEGRDDFVKTFKDNKLNIVSKASVKGSDGEREAKLSVETGDIVIEDKTLNINMKTELEEGKPSIAEMIPKDAADLTTMLITVINQMSQTGADTGLY